MKLRTHRRLLIGASSPVGYFYVRESERGQPEPILESPLSYCILYDELWFLSRKICPHNMEHLEFVHFVDEDLCPEGLPKDAFKDIENPFGDFPFKDWEAIIAKTIGTVGLRWSYDNHARALRFGELSVLPTPGRHENLLLDRHIATTYDMDLVENTANEIWSRKFDKTQLQLTISEKLLRSSIIYLQTVDGPWHPAIADLRSDALLKQYRRKIQTLSVDDLHDIDQRIGELSADFKKITAKIVEEHCDTTALCESIATFVLGFIPYVGNIISAGEMLKNIHDKITARRECGWVGFLGKAQQYLKQPARARILTRRKSRHPAQLNDCLETFEL